MGVSAATITRARSSSIVEVMAWVAAADSMIHYREWGSDRAHGLPVVFLHGNWSTHRWWIPVAEQLGERLGERRLLALDLRGRGDTQGPDHGYTLPELADDLLAFMNGLGLARAHLVGHSLGTGIAMQLALSEPERVASLVLVAPVWADGMPEVFARREQQAAVHGDIAMYERMLRSMAPTAELGELWEELVTTGHRQRSVATSRNLDALINWWPGDGLRALAMPRVVVDGELDRLCGGETARRATELLACERVQLSGVGHSPLLEAPAAVARVIADLVLAAE
jgi:3-oxoadipate enol-lactonase